MGEDEFAGRGGGDENHNTLQDGTFFPERRICRHASAGTVLYPGVAVENSRTLTQVHADITRLETCCVTGSALPTLEQYFKIW